MSLVTTGAAEPVGVADARLVPLPVHVDARGRLVALESGAGLGFDLRRAYYLYDVPGDAARGGHAHRALEQLMIAVAGRLDVTLDDGRTRRRVRLDSPERGLFVPRMVWREMDQFAPGTVCLVLASRPYEESDYLRDYTSFIAAATTR